MIDIVVTDWPKICFIYGVIFLVEWDYLGLFGSIKNGLCLNRQIKSNLTFINAYPYVCLKCS